MTDTPDFKFLTRHGFTATVFDWDGVVIDSAADYYRAYELTLQPRGVITTGREVYLLEGMTTEQVMTAVHASRGIAITEEQARELARIRREIYSEIARNQLFPGAGELIADLHTAGCKVGLVTGSTRATLDIGLSAELKRCFDAIVTGDIVTRPKPDPQPFTMALERMRVTPHECLVVENAPFGVQSGQRAGCRVVALCTTLEAEDLKGADWVIPGHPELRRVLLSGS